MSRDRQGSSSSTCSNGGMSNGHQQRLAQTEKLVGMGLSLRPLQQLAQSRVSGNALAGRDLQLLVVVDSSSYTAPHQCIARAVPCCVVLCLCPCSGSENTAKYVERGGYWHHLAVTWSVDDDGLTKIYWDGLLMAEAVSKKTQPLEPGGAFMLGAEQVCRECVHGGDSAAQQHYACRGTGGRVVIQPACQTYQALDRLVLV